ncbi:MAG: DUF1579 domain-containing protein [Ignavibacteria bacterium]|nr:DUF1579 domain-containing protein [Ignavibacteria bacterium]
MKKFLLITVLGIMCFSFASVAQEMNKEMTPEMKAWMEYMRPGEMHKLLAKCVGEWKSKITMWMAPDTPPTTTDGSAVYEMILGERYLQSKHAGIFSGMPMEGLGLDAYDNAKKTFYSVWIDNFGTGVMQMVGKYNAATKTISYLGTSVDPMTGKDVKVRQTIKFIDDNHSEMDMYMIDGDKEFKSMHIDLERKQN